MALSIYRYAIVWDEDTYETHDIVGTEEQARDMFGTRWLDLHTSNKFDSKPRFMELWRADDPDGEPLAKYEFHLGVENGKS